MIQSPHTCSEKYKGSVSSKYCCVWELEHCNKKSRQPWSIISHMYEISISRNWNGGNDSLKVFTYLQKEKFLRWSLVWTAGAQSRDENVLPSPVRHKHTHTPSNTENLETSQNFHQTDQSCCFSVADLHSPTPKKSGHVKMAVEGPAQGTSMGTIQARNTNSSVSGATTWFLSQRMSLRHNAQKRGSATKRKVT